VPDTLFDQVHRECRAGFEPPNVDSTYPFEKIGAPGLFTVLYVTVTKLPRKKPSGLRASAGLLRTRSLQQPRNRRVCAHPRACYALGHCNNLGSSCAVGWANDWKTPSASQRNSEKIGDRLQNDNHRGINDISASTAWLHNLFNADKPHYVSSTASYSLSCSTAKHVQLRL
jgi:hypothetical protein